LRIRRCGSFGNDDNSRRKCNFNCLACTDTVVMTPDYKIYPCIFLSKPGFEIGKMIDGKIIIFKDIQNTGKICLAQQVSNYGKKSFRLVKCEITKTNFGFEKDTIYDYIVVTVQ